MNRTTSADRRESERPSLRPILYHFFWLVVVRGGNDFNFSNKFVLTHSSENWFNARNEVDGVALVDVALTPLDEERTSDSSSHDDPRSRTRNVIGRTRRKTFARS